MDLITYGMAKAYTNGAISQSLSSIYKFIGQCTNAQLISKTRTNGNVWAIYGDVYNVNTSDVSQSGLTSAYISAGGPLIPIAGDEVRNVYDSKVYEYDSANGWVTQTTWTTSAVGTFSNGAQVAYSDTSSAWIELKAQMHVNVINSLSSSSTVDALAAAAGKTLNDSKQPNTIIGTAAPTSSTVGTVGQSYVNTTDNTLYKCTAISGSAYTWVSVGGGGSGTSDFDQLTNRPKYNGATMSSSTDIPEVKTSAWDAKSIVSGENDGTNWTQITINGTARSIPSGGGSGPTQYLKSASVSGQVISLVSVTSSTESTDTITFVTTVV